MGMATPPRCRGHPRQVYGGAGTMTKLRRILLELLAAVLGIGMVACIIAVLAMLFVAFWQLFKDMP